MSYPLTFKEREKKGTKVFFAEIFETYFVHVISIEVEKVMYSQDITRILY